MEHPLEKVSDLDIRHFIYITFARTTRPPTSWEISRHFCISSSQVEQALDRLADAHQIALVPGSHNLWMAHPFSAIPTNFSVEVAGKKYWGN